MKFRIIRYYKSVYNPSEEDIIVRYFYSETKKKWCKEQYWSYAEMLKCAETHENNLLEVIDELFDMLPTSFNTMTGKPEIEVYSLSLDHYKEGGEYLD